MWFYNHRGIRCFIWDLSLKKSHISSWRLRSLRLGQLSRDRDHSRIQSAKKGHPALGYCPEIARVFRLPPKNKSWSHWRTVLAVKASCIPVQVQWPSSPIWTRSARALYDLQCSGGLDIPEPPPRLTEWNDTLLNPVKLEQYADAVTAKGSPLTNCFGFIDGTVRPISRPGQNQRIVYNGHKRVHSLKFQSVTLPNGLIAYLFGPVGKLDDIET